MTIVEVKELLIGGINYIAYRETEHSLWPWDMNTLFGEEHYPSRPIFSQTVWGKDDEFENKMADLLRCAVKVGKVQGNYEEAIATLRDSNGPLGRVIRKAGT